MKLLVKRIFLLMLTNIIMLNLFSQNVFAEESEDTITPKRVYCKLYNSEGELKQEGYLPISEQEYNSRRDYDSIVILSGDYLVLRDIDDGPFRTLHATKVYLRFSLNRNINALVKIIDKDFKTEYKNWYGLTGGLSTSANVPGDAKFYGYIGNNSSDPVTVNWASIEY